MRSGSAGGRLLFNTDPKSFLPHRYPFLFLDRIIESEPGVRAVGQLTVTSLRVFPQLMMIESLAQLAGILMITEENEGGFLASIERAEFSGSPQTGDLLTVTVDLVTSFGRLFLVEGSVCCKHQTLLSARMSLGVGGL